MEMLSLHSALAAPVPRARATGRKLMIFTSGSRGDVQPFAALGSALQSAGFVVRIITNVNHVSFLNTFGLDTVGITYDMEKMIREDPVMREALAKGRMSKFLACMAAENERSFPDNLAAKIQAIDEWKPDIVITTPLEATEIEAIAGTRRIPVMRAGLQCVYPSAEQPTMLGEPTWAPHRLCGMLLMYMWWSGEHSKTAEILKQLPESRQNLSLNFREFMLNSNHPFAPVMVGFSPNMYSPKKDWNAEQVEQTKFTGFWVVHKEEQESRLRANDPAFGGGDVAALQEFLAAGPAVYIGWGSMIAVSEFHMACLAVRSLMKAGLRGIILGGWAKLNASMLVDQPDSEAMEAYAKDNVLFVKTAPHEWLFPQCLATVHHGGSGTTAAALRSGVPTVITPVAFDQFDNSMLAANNGVGIALRQFSKVTVADLATAINKCVTDKKMRDNAKAFSEKLRTEGGLRNAVQIVDDFTLNEVDTGKWRAKLETRCLQMRQLRQKPEGCFSWLADICGVGGSDHLVKVAKTTLDSSCEPSHTMPVLLGSSAESAIKQK